MLKEVDYNGIRFMETRLDKGKFAFTYSPTLEANYTAHKVLADQMAADGIDWTNRDPMVLRTETTDRDAQWSGITSPDELTDYSAMTSYLYSSELQGIMDNMDGVISKASGKLNEPSKLIVGSKPTGIFSMAHAARGLVRLPEYYSVKLEQVVDINRVDRVGDQFLYTPSPKEPKNTFVVEQRQKGTTEMLRINPAANIKFTGGGMMYTDPTHFGDHRLKFGTTVKKVYLHKSTDDLKGKGDERYLDLFVNPVQSASIDKEMWLYQMLPAMLVARAFAGSGFKIAIHKAPMVQSGNICMMNVTTVSNYDDPINYDAIARGGGDPRMIRHHDYGVFTTYQKKHFDYDYGSGIGAPVSKDKALRALNEYAFWSAEQANRGIKGFKNQNPTLYQLVQIEQGNDPETQKNRAITEFLSIMDTLGVQFQQAEQFARDSIRRYEEVLGIGKDRGGTKSINSIRDLKLQQPQNKELKMPERNFANLADKITKSVDEGKAAVSKIIEGAPSREEYRESGK